MIDIEKLLTDLTPSQLEAATHIDGPLLIIAAAGSGKTRVITRRVVHLIAQGVPPNAILAITFTNKAAKEMKDRVSKVLGRPLYDFGKLEQHWPTVCTFHSLCLRVLRHYSQMIGLPADFSIYDSSDQNKVLKDAIKSLDLSATNFPPNTVHASISNAKNKLITAEAFTQSAGDFYSKTIARIYTKYQAMLKNNNALDFDDLLLRLAQSLRDFPEMLRQLQDRFQYILIDEYQDTNHAQYVIAHALALRHRNMCVVGDPDQSIYAWRGADIQNILDFETDYKDAKVVKLEQNYRSSKTVLQIAGQLISFNKLRKDKALWTENPQGDKAKLFFCQDERQEAQTIADQLRRLNEKGLGWNGMAIFYRMNSLSRVMEDALRTSNIPYIMARGVEFYSRKEIKDTLAYLRAIANPADEVSLTRIINLPTRGIGDSSVKLVKKWAEPRGINLWHALLQVTKIPGLSTRASTAMRNFVLLMRAWRRMAKLPDTVIAAAPVDTAPPIADSSDSNNDLSRYANEADFSAAMASERGEEDIIEPMMPSSPLIANTELNRAGGYPSTDSMATPDTTNLDEYSPPAETKKKKRKPVDSTNLLFPDANIEPEIMPVDEADATANGTIDLEFPADESVEVTIDPSGNSLGTVKGPVTKLMEDVIRRSGMEAMLRKDKTGDETGESALDNISSLITSAAEYDAGNPESSLIEYLNMVSLVSDADHMKGTSGAVTMMTLHAAKGLEFPVVAMIGLEEGVLPHARARSSVTEMEEERRLCFVGITRAEKILLLSKANYRTIRGLRERTVTSPFLREMPDDMIDVIDVSDEARDSDDDAGVTIRRRIDEDSAKVVRFRKGQLVRHPMFGLGRILEISSNGSQTRGKVKFNTAGEKVLIFEAARLELVGD